MTKIRNDKMSVNIKDNFLIFNFFKKLIKAKKNNNELCYTICTYIIFIHICIHISCIEIIIIRKGKKYRCKILTLHLSGIIRCGKCIINPRATTKMKTKTKRYSKEFTRGHSMLKIITMNEVRKRRSKEQRADG